jgi:DNA-directed RNA polymerase specialized sigma24 family protein
MDGSTLYQSNSRKDRMSEVGGEGFTEFFAIAEPKLRRAFVAAYGADRGREAVAEALAYAWEHWERISEMENPVGYLYRVGQSRSRPRSGAQPYPPVSPAASPWVEPELPGALAALSERERLAVVLIEGFGWTFREVADLAGISVSSVQSYLSRGLTKLRHALGVTEDA